MLHFIKYFNIAVLYIVSNFHQLTLVLNAKTEKDINILGIYISIKILRFIIEKYCYFEVYISYNTTTYK